MGNSDVVIRVEGLGKKYAIQHEKAERYTTLREVWMRQAKSAGRRLNPFSLAGQLSKGPSLLPHHQKVVEEDFWALKDVSFEIRRGERVGIVGRNGAGKSTFLKILSRITEPSSGRVEIRGRVASLLEVGTGFHPELTGRENIYLNGAILGMTRREIRTKFDEIVDFSEVQKFLDTPVKRYSSGMYVRLAFAVAAHLEPEILVVDEVLAVGDTQFQNKCLGKIKDVSGEGKTVLFVSHNLMALRTLCTTGVFLENGRIKSSGSIGDVVDAYQGNDVLHQKIYSLNERNCSLSLGDSEMSLVSIKIQQNGAIGPFSDDFPIEINACLECGENAQAKSLGLLVVNVKKGIVAIHTESSAARGCARSLKKGSNHLRFTLPAGILKHGTYVVRVSGTEPMVQFHFDIENALCFDVVSTSNAFIRHNQNAWKATSSPKVCEISFD